MLLPTHAIVRPRGVCPETGDTLPLDELVESFVGERDSGAIEITGSAGSGKSTALAYLKDVLHSGRQIVFLDDASANAVRSAMVECPVVYTSLQRQTGVTDVSLPLASWKNDELIEYLVAAHHDRCHSLMARVNSLAERSSLGGNPELWRIVLDRIASDESAADIREILRSDMCNWLTEPSQYQTAREIAFLTFQGMQDTALARRAELVSLGADLRTLRLLRHRIVLRILATDRLVVALEMGDNSPFDAMSRELIGDTAREARNSPASMNSLHVMLTGGNHLRQSTAASILHATETGWKPEPVRPKIFIGRRWRATLPCLANARLEGAQWSGIDLTGATLTNANLAGADLTEAALVRAVASGFCLDHATLQRADLTNSHLEMSRLEGADFTDAILIDARLQRANVESACFRGARLARADLRGARIESADFSRADLTSTILAELPLRTAEFGGAIFAKAVLVRCDMEGMRIPHVDMQEADLSGALLTGSMLRRANLQRACLRGAGLADIDWEGADLRDADLRESSFYLGSSRSGLVGSPLACEGSRTGFYTDDYDQQAYKSPEEIRKANLRGADLRGANIAGVDFYLVDLRDAKYSSDQAEQLRRCGAILFERAAS